MTAPSLQISTAVALRLILLGVSVVAIAIVLPGLPIAASIALVALGSVTVLKRPTALLAALVIYAPLGGLAVAAQLHIALEASLAWRLWATLDAAVAVVLVLMMMCRVSEELVRQS